VGAIELLEVHSVAGLLEVGDQAPAGSLEGQDLVLSAMGNKDAWIAPLCNASRDETRRKCEHRAEQVAIGDAESYGNALCGYFNQPKDSKKIRRWTPNLQCKNCSPIIFSYHEFPDSLRKVRHLPKWQGMCP